MHLYRWLTSIVLLPTVIFLIIKGGMPFFLLISAVCALSLLEYFNITFHNRQKSRAMIYVGLATGILVILAAFQGAFKGILWLLAFNLLVCAVISVSMSKEDSPLIDCVGRQIQGMIYIPVFLSFLVVLRNNENGATWILLVLFVIFAGDVGAYYVGTYWGKHKLLPRVSPGKTVEGAIGGLLSNVFIGCVINYFLPLFPWGFDMQRLPWGWGILFFMVMGAMGQLGDLYESQYKRAANIKDSGKILPGHGGMLDRIDALLFSAPIAYFFKMTVL